MPLVRFQVRNEFGLGQPELYNRANKEDPKAVLDGVAVAGLVGILRQLGDLSEFAAEVFHGLQEQVMATSSRSHKLMARVKHIEAALPPLEKVVLAQTSHIHFAYTAGSEWHPRIENERNHFIYNDPPHFIMDSYEECRGPPRLHLLDKFDTGGPGSCLKRYSDPSFFKRVSAASQEANSEKVQRDRKPRRSKKKRSSKQNGEVSRGTSVSHSRKHSMQFIPPIVHGRSSGRSSPPQTASTADTALNYDPGDRLNSFNSRTESGYIECVFHPSSSVQAEGQESKDLPCFNLAQHNDALDSVFPDERIGFMDDNYPRSSLQEQMTSGSSCVTWDEKAEIMEPNGQESHGGMDGVLDVHQNESDIGAHGCGAGNIGIVDQTEMLDNENEEESVSSHNAIDEIDSEPDKYMDALNTIESESENDTDYKTKREVASFASISSNEGTGGMNELSVCCSDQHPTTSEPHIDSVISPEEETLPELPRSVSLESSGHEEMSASDISSKKEVQSDLPNSFSLDSHAHEHISQTVRESSTDHPAVINRAADALDDSKLESVIADQSSSPTRTADVQHSLGDQTVSTFYKSQESPADISSNGSMRFWTNGGLLGLEPSKPPDFTMSSPLSPYCVNSNQTKTAGPLSQTCMAKDEMHGGKPNMSVEKIHNAKDSSLQCSKSFLDEEEDGVSTKKTSQGFSANRLNSTHGNVGNCHMQNGHSSSWGNDLKETSKPRTEEVLPVAPNVSSASTRTNEENDDNSSLVFGLSRRLLSNSFGRKVSDAGEEKFTGSRSMNDIVLEQRSENHRVVDQKIPETVFQEQFLSGPILDSPTASPPLEHMKISFHPVDGFETSKLKLKFSDGTQNNESTRDMFPSFQLIPEPAVPLHDYGSNSDDDTFCRSSPSVSDDCRSHHSDSNSEQWECGESTEGKDREVYDALCSISSMERVSSSLELSGVPDNGICFDGVAKSENSEADAEPSLCNAVLDLPNFDAVKPALQHETKEDSDPKHLLFSRPVDPSPTPPPLPPMQWRVSKPHSDVAEDTPDIASEDFKLTLSAKLFGSTTPQQPKPAPAGMQQTEEFTVKPKSKEQRKLSRQAEVNHAQNGKGLDEREDFLQQIRTKSFNLRPTVTAKSTTTPGPTASIKVTAILEKANAIRQAVGSDDGEDDNWSDT